MLDNKNTYKLKLIIFVASLGGMLYGYDIGVISGTLSYLKSIFHFSNQELELIVGGVFIGGIIGSLTAGIIADYFGRKAAIFLSSLLFIIGVIIILSAKTFFMFFLGRLFLGSGIGFVSVVVPLYIVEISPAYCRGRCLATFQIVIAVGILTAYFVDFIFSFSNNWQAMFVCLFIPAIILFFLTFLLSETPRWLILKGKHKNALEILKDILPFDAAENEAEVIKTSIRENKNPSSKEAINQYGMALWITIVIASCNQLIGVNAILQYAPLIFSDMGIVSNKISMLGTVGVGLVNLLFGLLAMFLVDRIGRRPLFLVGTAGVFFSYSLLWITSVLAIPVLFKSILFVFFLLMFIGFYAVGPGTVVWLAISELLPNSIRAKGMGIALFFNSLMSALTSSLFLKFSHWFGTNNIFLIFLFFSGIYYLVVKKYLPESKKLQLEKIKLRKEYPLGTMKITNQEIC